MKYPIGTIFRPPEHFNWYGEVIAYKHDEYVIQWSDKSRVNSYDSDYMEEIIKTCILTYKLPYTISHDIPEELFRV